MGSLWNRSGTVERYADDLRASGALAYFYAGGTTTPMTVYQDAGESSAHPFPVVADSNGRWPDIFVPYTVAYDVQVKTADGVQLTYSLEIPNPDPIDLTVTIPASEKVQTGMIHAELVNTTKSGYVRLNGRTMGNGSSSGTERANADTSDLFVYLWTNLTDTIAPVSGGRGGSAAADYAANKTITLPDCRGAVLTGLDDMGNSAASSFSGLTFTAGSAIVAGSYTGANSLTLSIGNLPAHSHTATTSSDGSHTHGGATGIQSVSHTHSGTTGAGSAHQHDAFIGDDGHFHTYSLPGLTSLQAGGTSVNAGVNANQSTDTKTTGVKVRSTAGNAATADNKVANESAHTHSFTTGTQSQDHTHTISSDGLHSHTVTTNTVGSGTAVNNLPLTRLVTWFIKL